MIAHLQQIFCTLPFFIIVLSVALWYERRFAAAATATTVCVAPAPVVTSVPPPEYRATELENAAIERVRRYKRHILDQQPITKRILQDGDIEIYRQFIKNQQRDINNLLIIENAQLN